MSLASDFICARSLSASGGKENQVGIGDALAARIFRDASVEILQKFRTFHTEHRDSLPWLHAEFVNQQAMRIVALRFARLRAGFGFWFVGQR